MKTYLIADSGGTKTDWCFVNSKSDSLFSQTESYHPNNWSKKFNARIEKFWSNKSEQKIADLYFFGAGCLNVEKAFRQKEIFQKIGFNRVFIMSDLHAAAIACYGQKPGRVAIMGTGSVLFDWNGKEISNVVGGKGHLEGDEGSGYYFGYLVYDAYKRNLLGKQERAVFSKICEASNIENKIIRSGQKNVLSQIPFQLKEHKNLFRAWHDKNISTFCHTHIDPHSQNVSIVGNYAASHEEIIKARLMKYQVFVDRIIDRPIIHLIEQIPTFIE